MSDDNTHPERGISDSPGSEEKQGKTKQENVTLKERFSGWLISENISRDTGLLLTTGLVLVLVLRLIPLPTVYRRGYIVLSGNDPYFYRYWVERLAEIASSPIDFGSLSSLPNQIGEPLMIASLWWLTELLGGSTMASGTVLAWYPVMSALITGLFVYLIAVRISSDYRIGLAAVGLFAVTPGHAFRTGLGFADHHAFDYIWLAVTLWALIGIMTDRLTTERKIAYAIALGLGVSGQVLAWSAGPLLVFPLAVAVAVFAITDLHRSSSTSSRLSIIIAGLGIGALLSLSVHELIGWQSWVVAFTPSIILGGAIGILLAVEIIKRVDPPAPRAFLLGVEILGIFLTILTLYPFFPELLTEFESGIDFLLNTGGIAETTSVISAFGPVVGPVIMMGFAPYLGLPVTVWAVWRAYDRHEAGWLIISLYVWYFFGLALIQRRFTGELAAPLAILAGMGVIYLVSWLDLVNNPLPLQSATESGSKKPACQQVELPGRRRLILLSGLGLVFGGFSTLYTAVINSRLTINEEAFQTAVWINQYASELGLDYPENYVLSPWGRNRMYNYFVSGESESYAYAQRNYGEFIFSSDPVEWYERLQSRAGFVVIEFLPSDLRPTSMYQRLFERLGSESEFSEGVGHYRAIYTSKSAGIKVFSLVNGASITGERQIDTTIRVETNVDIEGASFTYRRSSVTDDTGSFTLNLAHPGRYKLTSEAGNLNETFEVSEQAVVEGEEIRL